jgi:MAC/Perforin domain
VPKDPYPEPEPDDWEPPSLDQIYKGEPLDTKRFTPDLTLVDVPPPRRSVDHTKGIDGHGPGEGGGHRDELTKLTTDDIFHLLKDNHIDLQKRGAGEVGTMQPFIVGSTLQVAGSDAVQFSQVKVLPQEVNRLDVVGFSYTEFESNLQRQTTVASSTEFGIPGVFQVDASYRDASAVSTYDKTVKIYFQDSQSVPKADVIFDKNDITLAPKFITTIEQACSGTPERLLNELKDYGHFVALRRVLGGRITLHTSTELRDRSQFETRKIELKTAAKARFSVDGVPLKGGLGGGKGKQKTQTQSLSEQAKSLLMELRGGDEKLASSEAGTLGERWISTIGPYDQWKTIGFAERSLAPIIEFLPKEPLVKNKTGSSITLKERCKELLKDYFRGQLVRRKTAVVGRQDYDRFGQDIDAGLVKRITKIQINHGNNIDGLRWWFELYDTASHDAIHRTRRLADPHNESTQLGTPVVIDTGEWIGGHRGEHRDTIQLRSDEEIAWIEVGTDASGGVVRIALKTNKNRYPNDEGFYGRAKVDKYTTIEAPRVKGFFGYKSGSVHGIGLSYLGLSEDAKSREYLLAMEPYLFPDYNDYGLIT